MIERFLIKLLCLLSIFFNLSHSQPRAKNRIPRIECTIDEKKGVNNPLNIYQCEKFQKCCLEYGKPSCCGLKSIHQIMWVQKEVIYLCPCVSFIIICCLFCTIRKEQLTLWGGMLGFVTIIILIFFCRRADIYCHEEWLLIKRFCRCRKSRSNKIRAVETLSKSGNNEQVNLVKLEGMP